jgi:hypothetical protein
MNIWLYFMIILALIKMIAQLFFVDPLLYHVNMPHTLYKT